MKRFSKLMAVGFAILLAATASLVFSTKAVAIDQITLKYGGVNVSVSLPELVTFADTGKASQQLQSIFQIANATPKDIKVVQEILAYNVKVNPQFIDDVLSSYYGKLVLSEVSKYVTPGSDVAKAVQDILTTLRQISEDGKISLLEILQNYQGTNAIVIEGEKVVQLYKDAIRIGNDALAYLRNTPEVKKLLCEG
jgi:hypothetical protein